MNKQQFINVLSERLKGLPENEINKSINYYLEMIDDRIEDGASEEEAVSALGSIDEIAGNIMSQTPLTGLVKQSVKNRFKPNTVTVILLILGSPIWLSLIIVAFSVILALYAAVFSIIVALFSIVLSFILGGAASVVMSPMIMFNNIFAGAFAAGSGLVLVGLGIFAVFACIYLTKFVVSATKFFLHKIKSAIVGKEKSA